jgi:hypothetical protein
MDANKITLHYTNLLRTLINGICKEPTAENIDSGRFLIEQTRIACDECSGKLDEAHEARFIRGAKDVPAEATETPPGRTEETRNEAPNPDEANL